MPNYRAMARGAARRHGIDPDVFERQINQESGFAEDVITGRRRSGAGALGIAQIMPATARGWGVNPLDPAAALDAAARAMAKYVRQFGNYADALRAYNAGPGAVKASRGYGETNAYVRSILAGGSGRIARTGARGAGGTSTTRRVTTTTPGVSNRAARAQLVQSFLEDRNADPVDLALQIRAAHDIAPTSTTHTYRSRSGYGGGRGSVGAADEDAIHGSEIKELFWQGPGGINLKNGQRVPQGFVSGHTDHVHVAAGPKTVVRLGHLAQREGLHVGEQSHFGGRPTSGHAPNSYHYRDEAIDASGTTAQMRRFARQVARYQRRRRR